MNKLSREARIQILKCLVEGNSLRSTSRLCGVSLNTVTKLLVDAGTVAAWHQDRILRDLSCRFVQCDEIWAFVGAKDKNATEEQKANGYGSVWTWTAIDEETKLIVSFAVGLRDTPTAIEFMTDVASRIKGRTQVTTDMNRSYITAVKQAFDPWNIDYARLHKIYGGAPETSAETRYSPAVCTGTTTESVLGNPDMDRVSTSHVERQNLTMRMSIRRMTRLTNGFSKKLDGLRASVALHFAHYNFVRVHRTLKTTPALASGVASRRWTLADLVELPY